MDRRLEVLVEEWNLWVAEAERLTGRLVTDDFDAMQIAFVDQKTPAQYAAECA